MPRTCGQPLTGQAAPTLQDSQPRDGHCIPSRRNTDEVYGNVFIGLQRRMEAMTSRGCQGPPVAGAGYPEPCQHAGKKESRRRPSTRRDLNGNDSTVRERRRDIGPQGLGRRKDDPSRRGLPPWLSTHRVTTQNRDLMD